MRGDKDRVKRVYGGVVGEDAGNVSFGGEASVETAASLGLGGRPSSIYVVSSINGDRLCRQVLVSLLPQGSRTRSPMKLVAAFRITKGVVNTRVGFV